MKKPLSLAPEGALYNDIDGLRRLEKLRGELLAAAVRHVQEGKLHHVKDRLRDASDASGIPRVFIESAIEK